MDKISVVIICKNEAHILGKTLESTRSLASEWLVYDTGSTDGTIEIARAFGARVVEAEFEGYGRTKQKAIALAANDWILNLDADEVVDDELANNLKQQDLSDHRQAFRFRYRNFIGSNCLNWGEFGFDAHIRLFHRSLVHWDDSPVHEQLQVPDEVKTISVKGHILHYTMKDTVDFVTKTVRYALANGESYYKRGRRAGWIKLYVAPSVTFFKYYILRLGFLDGWAGLFSARMSALYAYLKYARLRELRQSEKH
jgi:glycosyltransferase involved in cell wall biosynthesis